MLLKCAVWNLENDVQKGGGVSSNHTNVSVFCDTLYLKPQQLQFKNRLLQKMSAESLSPVETRAGKEERKRNVWKREGVKQIN